jgi:hemoglobin-like flavoprotein
MKNINNEEAQNSKNLITCWNKITNTSGADSFVNNFYQLLFKHYPDTRALFPDDMQELNIKLLTTLDNVINGVEYIEHLEKELIVLGEQHKKIGISEEMFDAFITTIVTAANLSSDFSLTDEELLAWENAFRKISNIMLKAY